MSSLLKRLHRLYWPTLCCQRVTFSLVSLPSIKIKPKEKVSKYKTRNEILTIKSNFQVGRVKLKSLTSHMWPPRSLLATDAEKIWSPSDFRESAVSRAQQRNDRRRSNLSCWRLSWKSHGPFQHSEDHFPSGPVGGHQVDTPPPPEQPLATRAVLHSVEQLTALSQVPFSNDPKRDV